MSAESPERNTRVTLTPEGPVLVDGPVEVDLPDGAAAASDRVVVTLCMPEFQSS
jgi:hypothetical protein